MLVIAEGCGYSLGWAYPRAGPRSGCAKYLLLGYLGPKIDNTLKVLANQN